MLSLLNSPLGFASTPNPAAEQNPCRAGHTDGAKVDDNKSDIWNALANVDCSAAKVQSGADVTLTSTGLMTAGLQPITASYQSQGMCAGPAPALHQPNHVHCGRLRQPQEPLPQSSSHNP